MCRINSDSVCPWKVRRISSQISSGNMWGNLCLNSLKLILFFGVKMVMLRDTLIAHVDIMSAAIFRKPVFPPLVAPATLSKPRHCLVHCIELSWMAIKTLDDHGWSRRSLMQFLPKSCKTKWWGSDFQVFMGFVVVFFNVPMWEHLGVPDQVIGWWFLEELPLSLSLALCVCIYACVFICTL